MFRPILTIVILAAALNIMGQLPQPSSGTIRRLEKFPSKYVDPRNIDVWLPEGYSKAKKYAVLYMHDGQMLFDATRTWNKQEWRVDETAGKMIKDRKVKNVIVVGIWNNGDYRHAEYFPQKALVFLEPATRDHIVKNSLKGNPKADNYLRFLVEELKPYIDKTFSVRSDVRNTFIAGSSMGGLISIYAICEYPNVFGGAAGISTHLPMVLDANTPNIESVPRSFQTYLRNSLPRSDSRKIYFDYGDQTLDAYYPALQRQVDDLMKTKGWTEKSWITRYFPGADHSEIAWAKRFNIPLEFLLRR